MTLRFKGEFALTAIDNDFFSRPSPFVELTAASFTASRPRDPDDPKVVTQIYFKKHQSHLHKNIIEGDGLCLHANF
jgi:hypothetical protein